MMVVFVVTVGVMVSLVVGRWRWAAVLTVADAPNSIFIVILGLSNAIMSLCCLHALDISLCLYVCLACAFHERSPTAPVYTTAAGTG